jgi:hypothetical protein
MGIASFTVWKKNDQKSIYLKLKLYCFRLSEYPSVQECKGSEDNCVTVFYIIHWGYIIDEDMWAAFLNGLPDEYINVINNNILLT